MTAESAAFDAFERKMRDADLPRLAIDTFRHYFEQLLGGASGLIDESEIEPARGLAELDALQDFAAAGREALAHAAVIKLNGGLATSMGMTRAKSLLEIKPGLSFLDASAEQVLALREENSCPVPLLLMNSFRTRDDSLEALARHPLAIAGLPLDFMQHRIPRIDAASLRPLAWEPNPLHEWCPPGHGDLYTALVTSGALDALRGAGVRYAFVSNSDNLGATLELRILGWMVSEGLPFVMEVTERTAADRKGGHLALRRSDGGLILREAGQCSEVDTAAFQDIERHRFFNTNNLWLDLEALQRTLESRAFVLGLPMIRNEKRCDPLDAASPLAIQLETAMGAAIGVFQGARALNVPRTRFAPVKTTSDLLAVMSDAYVLTDDRRVVRHPDTAADLVIELDDRFYRRVDHFLERVPHGVPSLRCCHSLRVSGDHAFGRGVVIEGDVALVNDRAEPVAIPDRARLSG
ncbi:MAG: UTP--glucose-1-phosphate uridylyltransferase [Myxococcota bacterium]|nr:UTP--glucose-1-phosphate uridylyltransferase [Myxococcota bacterium]